jgi:purine-nucleoside phosphorylase
MATAHPQVLSTERRGVYLRPPLATTEENAVIDRVDMTAFAEDIATITSVTSAKPSVALVLGSGLDPVAEALEDRVDVPYHDLTGMSLTGSVVGHAGTLTLGRSGDTQVACFRGRLHCYQGVSAYEASYPARLAAALGATTFVVTNAAGSVNPDIDAGSLVLIDDHINLMSRNPLVGWAGPEGGGNPFVPMGDAYDGELKSMSRVCAAELGIALDEGVYAGLLGPSYETPAEVRYLRTVGADIVGMSTVPEVIVARALGLRVLGISLVTNVAGGSSLSHAEVLEAGRQAAGNLATLLSAIVRRL